MVVSYSFFFFKLRYSNAHLIHVICIKVETLYMYVCMSLYTALGVALCNYLHQGG
jgi:hypothetical protein